MSTTTTEARKWSSTAGPIQTKKVNQALNAISQEGRSVDELYGVQPNVTRSSMMNIFGPIRKEAAEALERIAIKFDYQVTRENHQEVIAEVMRELAEVRKSRPVTDNSRSPEQEAERQAESKARDQERERKDREKLSQVEARAAELRRLYPWATAARNGLSDNARVGINLRAELAVKFPGQVFKVTTDYNSARIYWQFGPTDEQVKEVAGKYQNAHFDGMTDSTEYDHSINGEALSLILGRLHYISRSRSVSDKPEVMEQVCKWLCEAKSKPFTAITDRTVFEDGDELSDHAWRLLHATSFPAGQWKVVGLEVDEQATDARICHKLKLEQISPAIISPAAEVSSSGNRVSYNAEHQGVEISFPGKPDRSVLDLCKGHGFRWSMRGKVWYKKYSEEAWQVAHTIAGLPWDKSAYGPGTKVSTDPAGSYVQAQEDAYQDNIAREIGA